MKVLVVGGSGFIGTRLIEELLARGHSVTNFDQSVSVAHPSLSIKGDVRSAKELTAASAGHDAVIHLAAEHRDDVTPLSLYEEVNVGGAEALAAATSANGIRRVVFTSTVAVYGLDKNNAAEDTVPEPFNEYGRTKLVAEGVFRAWADTDPARALAIVRPSVVFGENNRGNVYNLARQVASGRFMMVGSGQNRKSMSYVGNIVDYLANCLNAPTGTTITNFADKPDLSTRELLTVLHDALGLNRSTRLRLPLPVGLAAGYLLDIVARLSGRTFPVSAIRIRKFAADTTVNTDRLLASGYVPRTSLEEAIRKTIAAEFPSTAAKESEHQVS